MTAAERQTGAAILDAAAALIGERGYRGTTTRAIAERAGVNEITIFRRYGSKRGLLKALTESWAEQMAGFAVETAPDPSDVRATLTALAKMEVAQAMRFGAPALRLALDALSEPEVMEVTGAGPGSNLDGLARYLATQQSTGAIRQDLDAQAMAEAFFALTSSFVMSHQVMGARLDHHGLTQADIVGQLLDIYLTGIGAA